jgi:predicted hydrocarbon binding protein
LKTWHVVRCRVRRLPTTTLFMEKPTCLPGISTKKAIHPTKRLERVVLLAMEEILGLAGVNEIFNLADLPEYVIKDYPADGWDPKFPLKKINHLPAGLESAYGSRAGRGLAQRIGRACFKHSLSEFGSELGFSDLSFRLLPFQAKLKTSNEAFAALFNSFSGQHIRLETDEKSITWRIEHCPLCRGRHSNLPCCQLAVGWLQEALFWISGGKCFEVEERKCIACGDTACIIVIDRAPMG